MRSSWGKIDLDLAIFQRSHHKQAVTRKFVYDLS